MDKESELILKLAFDGISHKVYVGFSIDEESSMTRSINYNPRTQKCITPYKSTKPEIKKEEFSWSA